MNRKSLFPWLGDMSKLARRDQERLVILGAVLALIGIVAMMVLSLLLVIGATKAVEWWRTHDSTISGMDDQSYTHCIREAESLLETARAAKRLEGSQGIAFDLTYARWDNGIRSFDHNCTPAPWRQQAGKALSLPEDVREWLPLAGLRKEDWPPGWPTRSDD